MHLYRIQIGGQVTANDILAFSPRGAKIEPDGEASSSLTVFADQSGLVGLIRQLHGLGFVLIALQTLS